MELAIYRKHTETNSNSIIKLFCNESGEQITSSSRVKTLMGHEREVVTIKQGAGRVEVHLKQPGKQDTLVVEPHYINATAVTV
jgi:hypothetical protein